MQFVYCPDHSYREPDCYRIPAAGDAPDTPRQQAEHQKVDDFVIRRLKQIRGKTLAADIEHPEQYECTQRYRNAPHPQVFAVSMIFHA